MPNTPTPNIGLNKPAQGDVPWDATINGNMDKLDSLLSGGTNVPNIALGGTLTKVNGVATVAGGVPAIVAKVDLTAQQASIPATTLYAVPANGGGTYRASGYVVLTQAGSVSSTLPALFINYTDLDTGVASPTQAVTFNSTTNVVGTQGQVAGGASVQVFQAKASSNIVYILSGYASSGATPMQYAVHIKLEYLGP